MKYREFQKIAVGIALLAACGSGAEAKAEEMPSTQAGTALATGLEIGGQMYYYKYEEPNFAELEGLFYGMSARYTYRRASMPVVVRGEVDFAWGDLDYSSTGTGTADSTDNFVAEPLAWIGYDFAIHNVYLTPYFGVGYRYLENNMGGVISTTGAAGYDRTSQYIYSPLGFELWVPLQRNWTATYILEYDIFWNGTQESQLSDVALGLSDLTNDQNDGFGVKTSLRLSGQVAGHSVEIEPFFRYWKVDDSDVSTIHYQGVTVGYGLEPENKTIEAGAKILLKF